MADQITTTTEVEVTRRELIMSLVQRELAASANLAPTLFDISGFAEPGAKSVAYPRFGSFSVEKLVSGQPASAQTLLAAVDKLDLDQLASVQFVIPGQSELQSVVDLAPTFLARAASAHGRDFDQYMIELMCDNAAAGNNVTYSAGDVEGNVIELVQQLDEANAPKENRFCLFRPAVKSLLLKVSNFVQADRYGAQTTALIRGELGMAYGVRFIETNLTTDSFVDSGSGKIKMLMYQMEGLIYAFQMEPQVEEQPDIQYGVGSRRYAVEQLYGGKVTQSGLMIARAII